MRLPPNKIKERVAYLERSGSTELAEVLRMGMGFRQFLTIFVLYICVNQFIPRMCESVRNTVYKSQRILIANDRIVKIMLASKKRVVMRKKTPRKPMEMQKSKIKCQNYGVAALQQRFLNFAFCILIFDFLQQGGCFKPPEGGALGNERAPASSCRKTGAGAAYKRAVNESARNFPVSYDVDIVVVGGTSGGVAAAVEAAQKGATVFLMAQRPYLGEDLCGTYRLWLKPGEEPTSPLARRLFSQSPSTPMHVKRTLDDALLDAGVQFLFGCYATDVLGDRDGNIAGIILANRSGRQVIKAKVIVDATPRATVARLAGAAFQPYPAGEQTFSRIVVGAEVQNAEGMQARKMHTPIAGLQAIEYIIEIPMKDGSFASFAEAEQIARDRTWHPGQEDASETLFQVPPDPMKGKKSLSGAWPGAEKVELDVFQPADIERLFVLGGCADMSREAAEKLLCPLEYVAVGRRIGAVAASQTKTVAKPRGVRLRGKSVTPVASGDIRENLAGVWSMQTQLGTVPADKRAVPVLGEYDVVVVGGGTGGAPAGIAAARQGAKTLVIEYLHGLGGVGTLGLIGKYYHGYRNGFTREIDEGLAELGGSGEGGSNKGQAWNIEHKMEWYRRELRKAGADIWFGTLGCGAFVQDGRVKGVVVATPQGRGVVLAKVVIDSTGNADIAAAAGATCEYSDGSGVAVQGAGLPPRKLGARYTNTDWTFIDDADVIDTWSALVIAKEKFKEDYDLGQLIDTRERRRIVGDFVMSPLDICNNRTYPDTVVLTKSDFDTHGFTIHPLFMLKPPGREERIANVPYRCLLPRGLDGILVTGLAISAHRDAIPILRMQADIQNEGYAAGVAAAMAAKAGVQVRDIDIKALQRHLIEKGNLPERVLTDKDSYPLPEEKFAQAVKSLVNDFEGLEIVLTQPKRALPLLQKVYKSADSNQAKLTYAHILGMFGDATGSQTLLDAVASRQWDKGWNYTGMGQYGASLSELDSLIIALGRTRDKRALNVIFQKVEQLDERSEFSHCRAVAMALETLAVPAAAKPLAELLKRPGIIGHAFTDIRQAMLRTPANPSDTTTRNCSLRELFLARALYRCGDYQGLGEKILKEYARDLRAVYRRHAQIVLGRETKYLWKGSTWKKLKPF